MVEVETPTEMVLRMQKEEKSDAEIITVLTEEGLKSAQISEALNQAKIKLAVEAKAAEKAKAAAKEAKEAGKARATGEEGLAPSILTTKRGAAEAESEAEEVPKPSKEAESGRFERVAKGAPSGEYGYEYAEAGESAAAVDTETIEEIAEEIINEKWEEAKAKISSVVEWKEYAENRLKSMDEKMRRVELALDRMQAALLGEVKKYGQTVKGLGTEIHSLEGAFSKILSPLATNIKELQRITGKLKPKGKNKGKEGKQQGKQGNPKKRKNK